MGTPLVWNQPGLKWNQPGLVWNGNLPERNPMSYQNIDAQVSDADLQLIKDSVAAIRAKLPFLISLSVQDRKRTFKAGPDSVSFVQDCLTAVKNNPTIVPGSFDAPGFESDVDLFAVLTEVDTVIKQLGSDVDDTRLAVGGEAMKGGTTVYNYVKTAASSTPGLKPVADQLGQRFKHANTPPPPSTPTP